MWNRFWLWVFRKRVKKYAAWCNYEMGFSGMGSPTALDTPPKFEKPWLPGFVKKVLDADAKTWAKHKQECFAKAVFDVTGESI
jgi:hypothetical protein